MGGRLLVANRTKRTEEAFKFAKDRGWNITGEYLDQHSVFNCVCENGHQFTKTLIALRNTGCWRCAMDSRRLQLDYYKKIAKEKGGRFVSGKLANSLSVGLWECEYGHQWKTKFFNISRGNWCKICATTAASRKAIALLRAKQREKLLIEINSGVYAQRQRREDILKITRMLKKYIQEELARENNRIRYFERYNTDKAFKLNQRLKSLIAKMIKKGIDGETFDHIIHYGSKELKTHLESKFKPGMNWKNYGVDGWCIDHIKPISRFCFIDGSGRPNMDQFKACWDLRNLQPLWMGENASKGSRYVG